MSWHQFLYQPFLWSAKQSYQGNHLTPEHISYLSAFLSSSLPRAAQGWLARLRPWPAVAKELEQSLKIVFDQCKQHLIDHIFVFVLIQMLPHFTLSNSITFLTQKLSTFLHFQTKTYCIFNVNLLESLQQRFHLSSSSLGEFLVGTGSCRRLLPHSHLHGSNTL